MVIHFFVFIVNHSLMILISAKMRVKFKNRIIKLSNNMSLQQKPENIKIQNAVKTCLINFKQTFLIHLGKLTPALALSSLYCCATSLNFNPCFNFSKASKHFPCFSHKMCLT